MKVGDRVQHRVSGQGTVRHLPSAHDPDAKVYVVFDSLWAGWYRTEDLEVIDADRGVGTSSSHSQAAEPAAGKKHDAEKPPLDLLDATALLEVGRVLEFGAKKYAPNNWRAGISRERLIAATLRHTLAAASGKRNDPESHLSHLAHAMCCLMFALHFEVKGTEVPDTRFKKKE